MPAFTIKGMPEKLLAHLRKQAKAERRSLNAEILVRLEQTTQFEPVNVAAYIKRRDARNKAWGYEGPSAKEIRDAIRDGRR